MSERLTTINTVNKATLKSYVKRQVWLRDPEFANEIDGKLISEAMIFVRGFYQAIKDDLMPPISEKELQEVLHIQGYQYIIDELKSK